MDTNRRRFLAAAGSTFTTSFFTGNVRGANDRIAVGFIGTGVMGQGNMAFALSEPNVVAAALCDVYQPNLDQAKQRAEEAGYQPKAVHDFREILADPSIDAVCISTPDHWHAYMLVEACKAGKDIYVEKPVCTYIDEAPIMIEAARKYERVVQVGTLSRSAGHMAEIQRIIRSGELGVVTAVRLANVNLEPPQGIGNPPDSEPPPGLDWDMWLGPAPREPYNRNRFHVTNGMWSGFRYYWDYAGGQLTDNGIHLIDLLHMAFGEPAPTVTMALGNKKYLQDSRETPDTTNVLYQYPDFIATYEHRYGNGFDWPGTPILVHGSKATLGFGRPAYLALFREGEPGVFGGRITPWKPGEPFGAGFGSPRRLPSADSEESRQMARWRRMFQVREAPKASEEKTFEPTQSHWANFLECMRTRQRPISDIELGARSTVAALLGNVSLRAGIRLEFDFQSWSTRQKEALPLMTHEYRDPWKLEV
jgi:predicted dehydrogenase